MQILTAISNDLLTRPVIWTSDYRQQSSSLLSQSDASILSTLHLSETNLVLQLSTTPYSAPLTVAPAP